MKSTFLTDYTRTVAEAIPADFSDNYDQHRFGPEPAGTKRRSLTQTARGKLARARLVTAGAAKQTMLTGISFVDPCLQASGMALFPPCR